MDVRKILIEPELEEALPQGGASFCVQALISAGCWFILVVHHFKGGIGHERKQQAEQDCLGVQRL